VSSVLTSLVVPCFNEEAGIEQLCRKLEELVARLEVDGPVEVVFVDDGSTDGTRAAIEAQARQLRFSIVSHDRNRGLGAALRTGFLHAAGEEVVTLDSDCTYDPAQVPELLAPLRDGADLVTASPYHPRGRVVGVSGWRLVLSRGLSWLYWAVLPVRLYTYTSCFRAYRASRLRDLDAPDDGFLAVTQLLVNAIERDMRVVEVPAVLTTRRFGQSKIRVVRVAWSHLGELVCLLRRRITGQKPPHRTRQPQFKRGIR
jgi:dolichol-phosphate mannosyltransferase